MNDREEGRFAGGRLFYRAWCVKHEPRGQVVLAHGYAEHSGRYGHVAEALNDAGLGAWALDHRGHGNSEGERANVETVGKAVADLDLFVDLVRERAPAGPLFLVGHSMGGLIATAYAEDHQDRLHGLVLSGALLHVDPGLAGLADLQEIPDLGLADAISSDPEVVRAYKEDPLVHLGPPPRGFLKAVVDVETVRKRLPDLSLPLLVMHGSSDVLVSSQALRDVVNSVSSVDLTAIVWPGMWHEIFNEPDRAKVLGAMTGWMLARVG